MAQLVKNPPTMWETWVRSLGWEDPLWRREKLPTPVFWPGEFYGLYSPGGRVGHDWVTFTTFYIRKIMCLCCLWSNSCNHWSLLYKPLKFRLRKNIFLSKELICFLFWDLVNVKFFFFFFLTLTGGKLRIRFGVQIKLFPKFFDKVFFFFLKK